MSLKNITIRVSFFLNQHLYSLTLILQRTSDMRYTILNSTYFIPDIFLKIRGKLQLAP